jgi:diaminopimelate epimerase
MKAYFYKYQALGNDMVVIDPLKFDFSLSSAIIQLICNRHHGLGADGICYGPLPEMNHLHAMRFFNPDGSEAEKSGNGLSIFARYLWDQAYVSSQNFEIWINGELIQAEVKDQTAQTITITLGQLSFSSQVIPVAGPPREVIEENMEFDGAIYPVTAATIGNPHCVIFTDNLSTASPHTVGPIIEIAPQFPNRTNVQFAQVMDQQTLQIEIWERGAGYTLASGTSASAAAGAAIKTGRCKSPVQVQMPGGSVSVTIDEAWRVLLTDSVEAVCQGFFAPDLTTKFVNQ